MDRRTNSRPIARPAWFPLVLLCICALTGSLVTRTFHHRFSHAPIVSSSVSHPVRQHLDRDASQWIAPENFSVPLEIPFVALASALVEPANPGVWLSTDLYNRPPPSF